METTRLGTVPELTEYFAQLAGGRYLFRGQTKHYEDAAGAVSISSSFDRKGCIPPLMRKWAYYANSILHALSGTPMGSADISVPQALLQHYGWRSFFVDLSASPAVAAWFASHECIESTERRLLDLDTGENVIAHHQYARYSETQPPGYIYLVDRETLGDAGHGVVELERYLPKGMFVSRISAQRAALVGPLPDGRLSPNAIAKRVEAPAEVLRQFAVRENLVGTVDLFPTRTSDPILNCLLSVPWERVEKSLYRRGLALPEYERADDDQLTNDAFCSRRIWISRHRPPKLANAMFVRVPELLSFATGPATAVRRLAELVWQHRTIVLETEGLLMHPHLVGRPEFGKGVVLTSVAPGTIEVAELVVEHPGKEITMVAVNRGYAYRAADDSWIRTPRPEDCPCADEARHEHLLTMATHLSTMVDGGDLVESGTSERTHADVETSATR